MLTATYTLVALSVELASLRASLQSLQKVLHTHFSEQYSLTEGRIDFACETLARAVQAPHWSKVDQHLFPVIYDATDAADDLLQELKQLHQGAERQLAEIEAAYAGRALDGADAVATFCGEVDGVCRDLHERLEREERALFPLARTVVSGEAWFAIANRMLAHEAYIKENRPMRPAPAASAIARAVKAGQQASVTV
ncbi:hemerythrin domain-containing protein [Massilia sp. DWR3-1-1]|uniref:hemerythrin domain-containing protein n=1 Tax=Massilia sp. DWR3-1-1 TaxID=2804559 RepID=UPI003CE977D1